MKTNRYRIFEDVPKKKVRTGKGETLVKRLERQLKKHKFDYTIRYRKGRMRNDLTETVGAYPRAAEMDGYDKTTGYWTVTWKENNQ